MYSYLTTIPSFVLCHKFDCDFERICHSNRPKQLNQPFFLHAIFFWLLNFMRNIAIYVFLVSFYPILSCSLCNHAQATPILCSFFCSTKAESLFWIRFFFVCYCCCRLCSSLRIEIDMLYYCCCFEINNNIYICNLLSQYNDYNTEKRVAIWKWWTNFFGTLE